MRNVITLGLVGLAMVQIAGCPEVAEVTLPGARVKTSLGDFEIQLDPENAPLTVANFLQYVDGGFYDGTVLHRVIPGSLVHGGGFTPGLVEKDTRPPIANEAAGGRSNVRGTVAMARASDPDSATAQFFVNLADNLNLDATDGSPGYAVFGRVIEGMDVVDQIAELPTEERGGLTDVPIEDVSIQETEHLELSVDSGTVPGARMETSLGVFVIELHPEDAPLTVENFLQYVGDGFYNGTVFHRVVPGFVVQGGGLTPGLVEKEAGPPIGNESGDGLANVRRTVAMFYEGDPNSATSQFFINLADNTDFDAKPEAPGFTAFGRVVKGMDVVDRIAAVPTADRDGRANVPVQDVIIEDVEQISVHTGELELTPEGEVQLQYKQYQVLTILRDMLVQLLGSGIWEALG